MLKNFFKRIYNIKTRRNEEIRIKTQNNEIVTLSKNDLITSNGAYKVSGVDFTISGIQINLINEGFTTYFISYDKIIGVI